MVVLAVVFKFQITKEVNIHSNIQEIIFKQIHQKTSNIFSISKLFYKNKIKIISRNFIINHLIELRLSSEIDNIIQEGEIIFKESPALGLPEVSKLIDSAISNRQGGQRKHSYFEKKNIIHKRENEFNMNIQKYIIML